MIESIPPERSNAALYMQQKAGEEPGKETCITIVNIPYMLPAQATVISFLAF